jgi:putative membrane protein
MLAKPGDIGTNPRRKTSILLTDEAPPMIRGYTDHAANERTFLAWVRTGIAVIAFGFVIEKFNLFILAIASATSLDAGRRLQLERLSGPFGRYDGLVTIVLGLVLILVATVRFVRIGRQLDDDVAHSTASVRGELFLSAALTLLVVALGAYIGFG